MARHDAPRKPTARRALAVLATAGAALGAGTATAAADAESVLGVANTRPTSLGRIDPQSGLQATTGTPATSPAPWRASSPIRSPARESTRSTTASAPSSPTSSR